MKDKKDEEINSEEEDNTYSLNVFEKNSITDLNASDFGIGEINLVSIDVGDKVAIKLFDGNVMISEVHFIDDNRIQLKNGYNWSEAPGIRIIENGQNSYIIKDIVLIVNGSKGEEE